MEITAGSTIFDPTSISDDLSQLLAEAKANLKTFAPAHNGRPPPTAFVLAGGGGKGAYEAGCLLALWDCGVRDYVAIVSTSVGGLNAAFFKDLIPVVPDSHSPRLRFRIRAWAIMQFYNHHTLRIRGRDLDSGEVVVFPQALLLGAAQAIRTRRT